MRGDANRSGSGLGRLKGLGLAQPAPQRAAALAVGAIYLGTLLFLPGLPTSARAVAAIATAIATALAWTPVDGHVPRGLILAAGIPLHLLVLATGGLASPALVLFAPWLAWTTLPLSDRRRAVFAAGALVVLVGVELWGRPGFDGASAVEAVLVVAIGVVVARSLRRLELEALTQERALSRILDEAGADGEVGEAAEAVRRIEELGEVLDRVRASLGGNVAVLWDVDPENERARPRLARGGPMPSPAPLRGDPLGWAWDEGLPMRIESAPRWADEGERACVVPVEPGSTRAALLSLTFSETVELPDAEALEAAAAEFRALIHLQRREAAAVATRTRFALLMEVLRRMSRATSVDVFAASLATSAMELAEGSGAAVALWENDAGRILAVVGEDGGPRVGDGFGPLDGEMGLAARNATTLHRERRRGDAGAPPVASATERWIAEPTTLVALPLEDAGLGVAGVLAVWRTDGQPIDPDVVATLEALAPHAALQLHQLRALGDLREDAARADHDGLTGIPNRRAFDAQLDAVIRSYHRYGRPFSLILLDVDHFKRINDTYGHEAGDAVLKAVASRIAGSVRDVDFAARYGGEEFAVLLPETGLAGAVETAERLRNGIAERSVEWRGQEIAVTISLGVAAVPECVADAREALARADQALYAAKQAGRNRVTAAPFGIDSGP